MPVDVELLKNAGAPGWQEEWTLAFDQLWSVAVNVVRYRLDRRFPQDVEDVASKALGKFLDSGLQGCETENDIFIFLKIKAIDEARSFILEINLGGAAAILHRFG